MPAAYEVIVQLRNNLPLCILYGAHVSWYQFFMINLIPVTLGNIVGGSFFVGTIYWIVYEYKAQENLSR